MDPSSLKVMLTTVSDRDQARRLARGLIDRRFASCVHVGSPVESVYRWEGNVEREEEVPLVVKTPAERMADASNWLRDEHPYETPELIVLDVERSDRAYEQWAVEQTREG